MTQRTTRLRIAARRLGIGPTALARAGGVSIPAANTHLSGKSVPAVTVAVGYCRLLGRINEAWPEESRPFKPEELTPEALFGNGRG